MDINYSGEFSTTYYADENKITFPAHYKELEEQSLQKHEKTIEGIIYVTDEYVAYADIKMTFTSDFYFDNDRYNDEFLVIDEVSNIRRKEYFSDPLPESELDSALNGIRHIKELTDYIHSCDSKIDRGNNPFTGSFI